MAAPKPRPLEGRLPRDGASPSSDWLLDTFVSYADEIGIEMYSAQEEAILEIFSGSNVILNTPTGSGKSLVALAACFKALAERRFAFYTAPIKALVTEKFFELCEVLGPDNVGMMTGDASVNADAPVICCTAEILSNLALREGEQAQADMVVMDEFHYYSDRDRGSAWQIPLLALPQARFLLMSATLGGGEFFERELTRLTQARTVLVSSSERPVPLDFEYSEKPLQEAILGLHNAGRTPAYVVHFSQRAACEEAQNLMSLDFLSRDQKGIIKEQLVGFRFDSPFGRELSRYVHHGVGVHHAGMLPKYRRLVERLARKGALAVICGTDTLGVGVNVPIRTVLFTQLCKFDGENTGLLSVRDFQQIAGRAGRRGFDVRGSVVVQAPEHEIENQKLKDKAADNPKKLRKIRLKKPPERGFKPWNASTLDRLKASEPETLVSRLSVTHATILNLLAGSDGCRRAKLLLRASHESKQSQRRLVREGLELMRGLMQADIVVGTSRGLVVNEGLQQDFSLNQALALYAVQTVEVLNPDDQDHALTVLSVLEATLETPHAIIYRQVDLLKARLLAELKAAGVEYEERVEALEKVEAPKPEAEFIYATYNEFRKHHPWVNSYNISPKSIVRDMYEQAASFNVYVKEYGLARSEGVLLRYLTDAYKALRQTIPDKCKTQDLLDIEDWLGAELRSVDASLIQEWEQLLDPEKAVKPPEAVDNTAEDDITRDPRALRVLLRNASWRVVQSLARQDWERAQNALEALLAEDETVPKDQSGEPWTGRRLADALGPYFEEYDAIVTNADARSPSRVVFEEETPETWTVRQILSDPEDHLEWALVFSMSLSESRRRGAVVMTLVEVAR